MKSCEFFIKRRKFDKILVLGHGAQKSFSVIELCTTWYLLASCQGHI